MTGRPSTRAPSTERSRSPARIPAVAAGDPALTLVTSIRPSRTPRVHSPTPVYSPSRDSSNSSNSPGE